MIEHLDLKNARGEEAFERRKWREMPLFEKNIDNLIAK